MRVVDFCKSVVTLFLSTAAVMCLTGCVTTTETGNVSNGSSLQKDGTRSNAVRPAQGTARSSGAMMALHRCGNVPFDGNSLPLVSPDGQFLATQTGRAPGWDTMLANGNSTPPSSTRVEIYQRQGTAESSSYELLFAVEEIALLGRSSNADGFLIESPREDGARWIGFVSWRTGTTQWLVQDDHINAFASLGPDGQLAWSRRAKGVEDFSLAVRNNGEMWVTGLDDDTNWLMPTWSGRAQGLFVFALRAGFLDVIYAQATNDRSLVNPSRRQIALAIDATPMHAFQAMNGHGDAARHADVDQLVFVHPSKMRAAIWHPYAKRSESMKFFAKSSWYGLVNPDGDAFVCVFEPQKGERRAFDRLLLQDIHGDKPDVEIIRGLFVPKQIDTDHWQFLMLTPSQSGVVGVNLLRFGTDGAAAFNS